jgi:hypothetical protein
VIAGSLIGGSTQGDAGDIKAPKTGVKYGGP